MADVEKKVEGDQQRVQPKRNRNKLDAEHVVRKRLPPRLPKGPNDVYVTSRSNFQCELSKCEKLLESGETEVFVHGLGSAVNRAVNLALQLQAKYLGTVQLAVNTSTVTLVDDLEPVEDHASHDTQTRQSSSIHIHVHRTALAGAQK